jgi:antitoxin component of MazEF toxin-antitoxin module
MFFSKQYKLQGRGEALVMTVPIAVVRAFNLTSDSRLTVSYKDKKLVIDLEAAPSVGKIPGAHTPARLEAA